MTHMVNIIVLFETEVFSMQTIRCPYTKSTLPTIRTMILYHRLVIHLQMRNLSKERCQTQQLLSSYLALNR